MYVYLKYILIYDASELILHWAFMTTVYLNGPFPFFPVQLILLITKRKNSLQITYTGNL